MISDYKGNRYKSTGIRLDKTRVITNLKWKDAKELKAERKMYSDMVSYLTCSFLALPTMAINYEQ